MTDEQINAAISAFMRMDEEDCHCQKCRPNYCTDLNAMHEAEKTLTKEQVREYQCYMYDMACEIQVTQGRWMPYSATARYRAEAFLRTLGKWEEGE
jgi:hypothetical protein